MEAYISSFLVVSLTAFIIIIMMRRRYELRIKFYETCLLGSDYMTLLDFLAITKKSSRDRICKRDYEERVLSGIKKYFDSRLNVRVTYSRIKRIDEFFSQAAKRLGVIQDTKKFDDYYKKVGEVLEIVVASCPPGYFAGCYVESLMESCSNQDQEFSARKFIIDFYNKCANYKDEESRKKFYDFIDIINKKIDEIQKQDYDQKIKDFLLTKKLKEHKTTTTTTRISCSSS